MPSWLIQSLTRPTRVHTSSHTQFQLLLFSGLAFFVMLPVMKRTLTITLDFDWFYRRFFRVVCDEFSDRACEAGLPAVRHSGRRRYWASRYCCSLSEKTSCSPGNRPAWR